MAMTDPIADFFTRIRNSLMARHNSVEIPNSKMKSRIAEILKEEGFIKNPYSSSTVQSLLYVASAFEYL